MGSSPMRSSRSMALAIAHMMAACVKTSIKRFFIGRITLLCSIADEYLHKPGFHIVVVLGVATLTEVNSLVVEPTVFN